MKKSFLIATAALFALILVYVLFLSGGNPKRPVKISVKKGYTAAETAAALKEKGVIFNALLFRALAKITMKEQKIMPGEYTFNEGTAPFRVLSVLVSTPYKSDVKVLIPEGWRAEEIAEKLEKEGVTGKKGFLKIVKERKLEGYLFPSTYFFRKNSEPARIADKMAEEFDRKIRPLFAEGFSPGLDEKKVLIIASVVEREAVIDSERPLISAVYLNRIKKGMPLEADPTVQYALGYWKKGLTHKDLRINSPYNTYIVKGLPPGPICNPGYASVHAVVNPAKVDALYFVADNTGKHVFNSKYSEHLKAIKRIRGK